MVFMHELRKRQESEMANSVAFAEIGQNEENCLTCERVESGVLCGYLFLRGRLDMHAV